MVGEGATGVGGGGQAADFADIEAHLAQGASRAFLELGGVFFNRAWGIHSQRDAQITARRGLCRLGSLLGRHIGQVLAAHRNALAGSPPG